MQPTGDVAETWDKDTWPACVVTLQALQSQSKRFRKVVAMLVCKLLGLTKSSLRAFTAVPAEGVIPKSLVRYGTAAAQAGTIAQEQCRTRSGSVSKFICREANYRVEGNLSCTSDWISTQKFKNRSLGSCDQLYQGCIRRAPLSASQFQCNAYEGENLGHRPQFHLSPCSQSDTKEQSMHACYCAAEVMEDLRNREVGSSKEISVPAAESGTLGSHKSLGEHKLFKSKTHLSLKQMSTVGLMENS